MTNRLQKIEKAINNMSDDKFNELLNELGVKVDKQWVPERGELYWTFDNMGVIEHWMWDNDEYDNYRLLMKNVFKTEEEAGAQLDFNIEKAKLIKEIKDSSDVIDWWDDVEQEKYSLYYDHLDKKIFTNIYWGCEIEGTTYTTNKEFLENLIKNEPERVKKYLFGIGEEK